MNHFERTYQTAKRNYQDYNDKTKGQRSNLAFGAAGNLSKASKNRFFTIREVSHEKGMKETYRRIMLDIYNANFYGFAGIPNWEVFDKIIMDCSHSKAHYDEFDYWNASFSHGIALGDKIEAIEYFINKYGRSTDKKILIPKLSKKTKN